MGRVGQVVKEERQDLLRDLLLGGGGGDGDGKGETGLQDDSEVSGLSH